MYVLVGVLKPLFIDDIIKSTLMFLVLSRKVFPVRLLVLHPLPLFNSFNHCISQWRKNKYSPRCWNENQVRPFNPLIPFTKSNEIANLDLINSTRGRKYDKYANTSEYKCVAQKEILSWDSADNIYYDPKDTWWNDARSQSYGPHKKTQALQILFAMSPLRQPLMPWYLRAIHSMW